MIIDTLGAMLAVPAGKVMLLIPAFVKLIWTPGSAVIIACPTVCAPASELV
jgi:hypothetical protein